MEKCTCRTFVGIRWTDLHEMHNTVLTHNQWYIILLILFANTLLLSLVTRRMENGLQIEKKNSFSKLQTALELYLSSADLEMVGLTLVCTAQLSSLCLSAYYWCGVQATKLSHRGQSSPSAPLYPYYWNICEFDCTRTYWSEFFLWPQCAFWLSAHSHANKCLLELAHIWQIHIFLHMTYIIKFHICSIELNF